MSNIFNPGAGGGGGITALGLSAGTTNTLATGFSFVNSNGITWGLNGNTITASVAAAGGGLTNINVSAGTTSNNLSNLIFANLNGVSFGLNGSTLTASHNGLTTARASTDAIGLNTAQTNVTWTVNSSGLSLNAAGYAGTGFTTTTAAGAVIAGTHGTNGLLLAVPAYLTTAMASNAGSNFVAASAAFAGTNASGTIASNGFSISVGNYITTARASNDAIGLNTAQSNVTWTVNSSGLSLDARGYAGTGTTFAGTNVSASATLNSNGLNLALSAAAGGGGGTITAYATSNTTQSSSGTIPANSLIFAGAGIASVGVSNGSIIVSVPSGGGAGDGGVFAGVSNLGNTAGSTGTVSTGNFVLVGASNITLNQSTGAAGSAATVSIIGPNSSSLVAVSPIGLTTNGSTISVTKAPMLNWVPFPLYNNTSFSSFGQNTLYMQMVVPPDNVSISHLEVYARGSFVSSSNSQVYQQTVQYGLYSQGTGASTSLMTQLGTSSVGMTVSYNSNTAYGYTLAQGASSITSSSGGTALATQISGPFHFYMPFATQLDQNGHYGVAIKVSSATTVNTGPMRFAPLIMSVQNSLSYAKLRPDAISAPSATNYGDWDLVAGTVTTAALPSSIAFNAMSIGVSRQKLFVQFEGG